MILYFFKDDDDNDCLRMTNYDDDKTPKFLGFHFSTIHPKTLKEILPYIGKSSKYALLYGY